MKTDSGKKSFRSPAGASPVPFTNYNELFIHFGIGLALFFGGLHGYCDLDERAFADAGAIFRGAVPGLFAFDDLGPEWERAALGWLGGVDAAAVSF